MNLRMPAYNYNGLYAILFIGFMTLNLYLFANMFLAAISTSFKNNLKVSFNLKGFTLKFFFNKIFKEQTELKEILKVKRKKLESAFHLLKSRITNDDEPPIYAISYDNFVKLVKLIDSKKSEVKIRILFKVLDFAQDYCLRNIHFN